MATYAPNQLHSVPLAELQPDPMQPRKYLDPLALEELTASVGQVGIIEPIAPLHGHPSRTIEATRATIGGCSLN